MSLLIIKTKGGDYVEADDRARGFFLAAHANADEPCGYAKLSRKEARWLRDKLTAWLAAPAKRDKPTAPSGEE